jgi:hypothetical protein
MLTSMAKACRFGLLLVGIGLGGCAVTGKAISKFVGEPLGIEEPMMTGGSCASATSP